MKKVLVNTLRAGMLFSHPVFIKGTNMLVPAGIAIRKKDLERLNSWGINTVETEGEPVTLVDYAVIRAREEEQNAARRLFPAEVQENRGAYRSYTGLIQELDGVFSKIAARVSVDVHSIDVITNRLLEELHEQRDQIVGYILGGEVSGRELAKSSVNTAILSALTGTELKLPNHKILQLVTGALFHDVGMLRMPEIINKKGELSEGELQQMQNHPQAAYKIVCKELLFAEDVGFIAIQHHERWDGTGYPRQIARTAIDIGARIVSVADAFEAMASKKPYRDSMTGYQAMKNLLSDNGRRFDPDVLKAFIKTMGIYPIWSIVLLNNGAVARVLEVRGDAPLRPKIRIVINRAGRNYPKDGGPLIDLLAEKGLFIAKAVAPGEYVKKE
jgi:HD-GYP domain-containing protein (c-di-GMP phosphodiesterase class II)